MVDTHRGGSGSQQDPPPPPEPNMAQILHLLMEERQAARAESQANISWPCSKSLSSHNSLLVPNYMHPLFSRDGLRVQLQMYSRLCPWLFTWLDYEEEYEDEGSFYDDYVT
jgi:hypothetical protein